MSKMKKPKKARRPNIPLPSGAVVVGGGAETLSASPPARSETTVAFDYTHIKNDLARIGILAGSFFALLIVLSFFIK